MAYQFMAPGRTFLGEGALELAGEAIRTLGRKALIVTGKIVTKMGLVKILTDYLDEWEIAYEIFSDIPGEPTDVMVKHGAKMYEKTHCEFLIGIGGGSPLDSAKAIAVLTQFDGSLRDLMGKECRGDFPKTVLIPTTAGTGSEATKFFVVTDVETQTKMPLGGESLLPEVAVVDPAFTVTAPPSVTTATGMDALTHAVESYTSRRGNPLTDLLAQSAVSRIFQYLPTAYADGGNRRAREEMALAAYEAGLCINNASVTLIHGLSRPIGALFHVPHGISNAMLCVECLKYALDGCYDKFAALGRLIGAALDTDSDKTAAESFLAALERLCETVHIPTLREYGIDEEAFQAAIPQMADAALASKSPANTIKEVRKENIMEIYRRLW